MADLAGDAGSRGLARAAARPGHPRGVVHPAVRHRRRAARARSRCYYREPRAPEAVDLRLVEKASHLAEIAIERDRSQEALARGMQLLEQVLDTLPVGVWVLEQRWADHVRQPGRPGHLGRRAVHRHRGLRRVSRLVGRHRRAIAPEDWAAARAILKGETSLNEVVHIESFDGVQKTILNSAVPLRSLEGEIVGAILVNQDITRPARRARRRSGGARSSCARRRRWRRWASSPAASPTTSTTCSPSS